MLFASLDLGARTMFGVTHTINGACISSCQRPEPMVCFSCTVHARHGGVKAPPPHFQPSDPPLDPFFELSDQTLAYTLD